MPNPPKTDPARGHRGRGPLKLPAEGRKGPTPEWPLLDEPSDAETHAWAALWSTPQAVAWERMGWTRTVARYCRIMVRAEEPEASASLVSRATELEDRLGLTPKAMRLLLWEIAADEVDDRRQQPRKAGARSRIKAVG